MAEEQRRGGGGGGRGRGGSRNGGCRQGGGRPAPFALPTPEGLQVLLREDRLYRLQGRADAHAVRAGSRQDPAAPDLGRVCALSKPSARCRPPSRGLVSSPSCPTWRTEGGAKMEVILREHVENLGPPRRRRQGRQRLRSQLPAAPQAGVAGQRSEPEADRARAQGGRSARTGGAPGRRGHCRSSGCGRCPCSSGASATPTSFTGR